ncbi:MAG: Outer rane efflux protein [Bacteroidetes bacterium]|nr:Outer rane efflux protein [Bacteroidota bacterium]
MKHLTKHICILLLVLPFVGFAQKDSILTYQQAIEIALKNNYDIQIAKNNVSIADKQNTYGAAGFLPRVDALASGSIASNSTHQEFSTGAASVNKDGVTSNAVSSGVYLTWTVFDGLKMFATKERLQQLEEQGQYALKIQIENTMQQVALSYFQVVKQQQLIRGINAAKAVSEERIKIADKKLTIGSGSNVDLLQAKLDMNALRSQLLTEQNSLSEYKSNLLTLLKVDPFSSIAVDTDFTFETIKSVDEIKQSIEKTNSSVLFAQKNISVYNQYIKEVRSQALPKLALNANYLFGRNENSAGFTLLNQNLGYNLGFTFSWNLYNGWNTHNQITVAQYQLQNSILNVESLKLNMYSTTNVAYLKWLGNKQILDLEEENIKLAEESLKITTERLRIGLGSSIEIIESQQSYEDAVTRLVNARYNVKEAEVTLKKLTGELVK